MYKQVVFCNDLCKFLLKLVWFGKRLACAPFMKICPPLG